MLKEISKKSVLGPWLCYSLYIFYSFHNESLQMTSSGEDGRGLGAYYYALSFKD